MTGKPKRARSVEAGGAEWLELLAQCVDTIGHDDFPRHLVCALRSLVEIDYSVSFGYLQSEQPLCLSHTFTPDQRVVFVDDYLKGPYLLDPFFTACGRKADPGLSRLRDIAPDRFYQSAYYRSYYIQTGLSEEICYTFYLPKGVAIVISLMRSGESSRFSAREFRILESVTPVVVSLAKRHWQDIPGKFDFEPSITTERDNREKIETTVNARISRRITPREAQVAGQVLEGHSSEAIAKSLGITAGTVRIHRRNIYAKLQISSQQELFSIFFPNIAARH